MQPLCAGIPAVEHPVVTDLEAKGWSVRTDFIVPEVIDRLIEEAGRLWEDGCFRQAGIGAGTRHMVRAEIRSDHVLWLDEEHLTPAQAAYWHTVDVLRQTLNESFFLGLRDFEAHLAAYPAGSFYKRHLDQFKTVKHRLISCLLYLNEDWQEQDGGQLRIYHHPERLDRYTDVYPRKGTFVCFRSDVVYHEVLPAQRTRLSLTGWLRRQL